MKYIYIDESEVEPALVDAAKKVIRFVDKDVLSDSKYPKIEDFTIKWYASERFATRFFGKKVGDPGFRILDDVPPVAMVLANEPGVIRIMCGNAASVRRGIVSVAVQLMLGYCNTTAYMSGCRASDDRERERIDNYVAEALHRYKEAYGG